MKYLRYTDRSRWYGLYWDFETMTLRIKIHSYFIEKTTYSNGVHFFETSVLFKERSLFDTCETKIGQKTFGFNESIFLVMQEGDWFVYQLNFSAIQISSLCCKQCEGTGRRYLDEPDSDETCWYCGGTKKERIFDYDSHAKLCFSLCVLFKILSLSLEEDVPTNQKQLCELQTVTRYGFAGYSIGGCISPTFVGFIERVSGGDHYLPLKKVVEVMQYVDTLFHGRDNKEKIRAYIDEDQFFLTCPGNACELNTERSRGPHKDGGEGVTCHNLDSPTQQLTLLSGFSVLCTMYDTQEYSK